MLKKIIYLGITLIFVSGFPDVVTGKSSNMEKGLQENVVGPPAFAIGHLIHTAQPCPLIGSPAQGSKGKEYEELQKELKGLLEELKRLEHETREKFIKEILPQLKKEIEKLRERLRQWHPDSHEPERKRT